jgi:O-antigen ligase
MNGPILVFFLYCAVSIVWSDYPDVAFRRWIKSLGDLVMVLIVVTDPGGSSAIKRFLTRAGFLLVPSSVLLIKYYPNLGWRYDEWNQKIVFTGVSDDKNMLGVICLIFGLCAVWRIIHAFRQRQHLHTNRPLIAQLVILAMVFLLFWKANSMTSLGCFVLAGGLVVSTSFPLLARRRAVVHLLVVMVLAAASFTLFVGAGEGVLAAVGRDPTLTDRTTVWKDVLSVPGNPVFGTGFESFWLGPRLDKLWSTRWWHVNEAHNGYIEVFLNLGWVGLGLLAIVILAGYRNAVTMLRRDPEAGRLRLAFLVVGLIYSFTEAGFRTMNPVWISFMLVAIAVPKGSVPRPSGTSDSLVDGALQNVVSEKSKLDKPAETEEYRSLSSKLCQ